MYSLRTNEALQSLDYDKGYPNIPRCARQRERRIQRSPPANELWISTLVSMGKYPGRPHLHRYKPDRSIGKGRDLAGALARVVQVGIY